MPSIGIGSGNGFTPGAAMGFTGPLCKDGFWLLFFRGRPRPLFAAFFVAKLHHPFALRAVTGPKAVFLFHNPPPLQRFGAVRTIRLFHVASG
jgi:hypothetical protein